MKWPVFCRWHFQLHFVEGIVCTLVSKWHNIYSGNGLRPNDWKDIIWTNDDFGLNEKFRNPKIMSYLYVHE